MRSCPPLPFIQQTEWHRVLLCRTLKRSLPAYSLGKKKEWIPSSPPPRGSLPLPSFLPSRFYKHHHHHRNHNRFPFRFGGGGGGGLGLGFTFAENDVCSAQSFVRKSPISWHSSFLSDPRNFRERPFSSDVGVLDTVKDCFWNLP